jgi:hypothetical protein
LLFLNDSTRFAHRHGITDRTFLHYLRARGEAWRVEIRNHAETDRFKRRILRQWKERTESTTFQDLARDFKENVIQDDNLFQAFMQDVARAKATMEPPLRMLLNALILQEFLNLLGHDPDDFDRFRPLLQDWEKSGALGAYLYAPRTVARFFPEQRPERLEKLVSPALEAVLSAWGLREDAEGLNTEGLKRSEQRLKDILGPSEQVKPLLNRALVCRLCERIFFRQRGKRAQQYCPACRRRWSKQELWYKSGGREKIKQWRVDTRGRQMNEQATRAKRREHLL